MRPTQGPRAKGGAGLEGIVAEAATRDNAVPSIPVGAPSLEAGRGALTRAAGREVEHRLTVCRVRGDPLVPRVQT